MLRRSLLIAISFVAFACSKDKAKDNNNTPPTPQTVVADAATAAEGGGSAMAGSGSAEGSGSAMAGSAEGSGSGMAGSAGSGGSAAAGSGSAAATAAVFDFDKLSHDDKVKFMKTKVMPAMKVHFQKFDPKEFANFTCKTCHGKDPQKTKYEMPSKDLPGLDFDALKAGKEDPKMVEFMSKVVKPTMAKLLNEKEMTETEPKGFGCLHCHTLLKKK